MGRRFCIMSGFGDGSGGGVDSFDEITAVVTQKI